MALKYSVIQLQAELEELGRRLIEVYEDKDMPPMEREFRKENVLKAYIATEAELKQYKEAEGYNRVNIANQEFNNYVAKVDQVLNKLRGVSDNG